MKLPAFITKFRTNAKKVSHHHKSEDMNPLRDWAIGLSVAVLVFIGGISFIGYDFYSQFGSAGEEAAIEAQPVTYRDKEVRAYAEHYTEVENTFNKLRSNRAYVPPPAQTASTTSDGALAPASSGE
jgi:hypothetical protein